MITLFKNLWNDESGQGLVEYALILALIAVVCILAVTALGTSVKGKLNEAVTGLGGTPGA